MKKEEKSNKMCAHNTVSSLGHTCVTVAIVKETELAILATRAQIATRASRHRKKEGHAGMD
jgi:hypothetical protein